ncbi:MAG: FlgO family outer membrane protein [Spirosomataceae bacterium]
MKKLLLFFFATCYLSIISVKAQTDFKQELKKLADDLTQQIKQKGNKRLAVASFNDLQNNETELGKYLAQQFSGFLIRNGLDVVDRSRIDVLMKENKMTAQGLLDPQTQVKLGKLAGIEIIIVGSTTPLDKTVELILSAIDITRGSAIAATDGTITRTEAINDLLRSKTGSGNGSTGDTPFIPKVDNQDIMGALMGDKSIEMKKGSCEDQRDYIGQVCFENTLKQPLVLYKISGGNSPYYPNLLIDVNGRNCTEILNYAYKVNKLEEVSCSFYFHTAENDESKRLYGKMPVNMEPCKTKVRIINSSRLFLSKTQPN